ncbi:hypothetical protein VNO77_25138 [Canavalia gladiata]|uniref:Uncharacterized protein n=1 Tax=Canavalia gladiata TaxID=3824 RepID=A0AAN9QD93_CANGL
MSCTGTCFFKGRRVKNYSCTSKKVDGVGVAGWLRQSIAAAFFASLEWCSCMHVDTTDGPDDHSTSAPLILNAQNQDSASTPILKLN